MKRLLLLASFICLFQSTTFSQVSQTIGFELGQASIIGDVEADYWAGLSFAYNYDVAVYKNFLLGGSFIYSQAKGKESSVFLGQTFDPYETISQSILLKTGYRTNNWKGFNLKMNAGLGLMITNTIGARWMKAGIFRIGETEVHRVWQLDFKILKQITNKIKIGLCHSSTFTQNDYLDGVRFSATINDNRTSDILNAQRLTIEYRF